MYGCLDHESDTRANRCLFLTRLVGQQEEGPLCPFLRRLLIPVNEYIYFPDSTCFRAYVICFSRNRAFRIFVLLVCEDRNMAGLEL